MNKIDISQIVDPNIEQGFTGYSVDFLQKAIAEGLSHSIIAMIGAAYDPTKVYILWGCVRSGAIDGAGSGAAAVAAGAVFFNGEAYTVAAFNTANINSQNLYSAVAVTNDPTADPAPFTDGVSRNVHNVRKWLISQAGSGAILFNSWISIPEAVRVVGAASQPAYTADFQDIVAGSGLHRLGFWKDAQGLVHIQGNFSSKTNTGTLKIFTLPAGYVTPDNILYFPVINATDGTITYLSINSSGDVFLFGTIATKAYSVGKVAFRVS